MTQRSSRRFDIAIVGETNLDLILYGLPESIPMERELLASGLELTLGGSSSILAHNLSALGSKVGFVTLVGDDDLGEMAIRQIADSGVHLRQIPPKKDMRTGMTVLLPHGSKRHIFTYSGAISGVTMADLDLNYLTSANHFHLSSLFLQSGLREHLPHLFRELRSAGLTISLDTNDDPTGGWQGVLELLDSVDLILPNEDEAKQITGKATLDDALDMLSQRVGLIVVKCGPQGAIVQQGRSRTRVSAVQVSAVDTIGAGDSFNAGFLHSYLQDHDALRAATMGNIAGALSTLKPGGTEAFRDEPLRKRFLAAHSPDRPNS